MRKPKGYWTKEKCYEVALKYKTRIDFKINYPSAYSSARKNIWLNEICSHMKNYKNDKKRCIYAFEFDNNFVYIGLTYNLKNRINKHLTDENSQVFKHVKTYNLKYNLKQLTEYLNPNDAKNKEQYYVNLYKENNWIILNIAKAGGLGGNFEFWTYDECKKEALKYDNKTDFYTLSPVAYTIACKYKWKDDITKHMKSKKKPNGYWTKEHCHEEALKYKSRSEFKKYSRSAYRNSTKKWMDEICSHMIMSKKN